MSEKSDRVMSGLLVVAALIVAGSAVFRLVSKPPTGIDAEPAASKIANWRQLESQGFQVHGSETSKTRITVFADFECPACRILHKHFEKLIESRGNQISITYLMFPLSYHRFARSAGDATACVEMNGGSLRRWIDAVYEKQDSIGLRSWQSYAADAGLASSTELTSCLDSLPRSAKVDSSIATSERLGIDAAPTILINGWRFSSFKSAALLDSALRKMGRLE